MISEKKIKAILGEKKYEDVVWDYDESLIQIIKFVQKDKKNYNLTFNNLKEKYDLMMFLNEDDDDFKGYCNCKEGKEGKPCEHLIWALFKINEDLQIKQKKNKEIKSDKFKLDVLKDLASFIVSNDEVFIDFIVKSFEDEKVHFEIKVNINKQKSYKVTNIEKFLMLIKENKNLNFGKEFNTSVYKINEKQKNTFLMLDYINLLLQKKGTSLNLGIINYELFEMLLETLINTYITIKGEEYLIVNSIRDVNLFVKNNKDKQIELEFINTKDYTLLNDNVAINNISKTMHILEEQDYRKLKLLNSVSTTIKAKSDGAYRENYKYKVSLNEEDTKEFKTRVLPKIFNEFDVNLDESLGLHIISDKLKVLLYCYRDNKDIAITPRFMYGQYDALEENDDILIRRNKNKEDIVLNLLTSKGYEYDHTANRFIISNKRSQYLFLTEILFELKDQYQIEMDEKLKKGILNFDSSSISINVNKNTKVDFFEIELDIPNIKVEEIDNIINAFLEKRTFYTLEDNSFLKLNDKKVYEQLLFVKEIIKDNTYKLNTYRIPEYKAVQMEVEIKNKFNKYNINQAFINYIESIKVIEPIDKEEFEKYSYELRSYQKKGVEWLSNLYEAKLGALLADEMGLGKTLQTIAFLQIKKITSALIIVPKALIYNWVNELEKFAPELEVIVIDKDKTNRENQIKKITKNSIVLTSYNSLVNDRKLYESITFNTVVIDEAQYIKNPTTKTARCVKSIKARFYIALSGTPIQNHLIDMWSIFDFLLPGYYSDLKTFNKKYKTEEEITNLNILKETSAPFIMRRLKKEVLKELPDKIETNLICEMEDKQKAIYYEYNNQVLKEIDSYINTNEYNKKSMEILAAITRLRQIALSPQLISKEYKEHSGKIEMFEEIVQDIIESQEKVLVFSQYTSLLHLLENSLNSLNIKYYYLDGKTPARNRLMDVEKFNKNTIPVYLISLKAGGVGLNLSSANNVIIMDPWWNPAVENQAIDRAHRIGQKNKVQVYKLISKDTIEEKIMQIKEGKDSIVTQVLSQEAIDLIKLNTKELINLLRI